MGNQAQHNPPPEVGEKLWHVSHEFRGNVIAIIKDEEAFDVMVVRFWFRRKQRWHHEVIPMSFWGHSYSLVSRDRPEWHAEQWARRAG